MQFRDNWELLVAGDPNNDEAFKFASLNLDLLRKRAEVPSHEKSEVELLNDMIYGLDVAYSLNLKGHEISKDDSV